jgi:TP901 family phage tail tape measure protein
MALLVGELYALLFLEKKMFMAGLAQAQLASSTASSSMATNFLKAGKVIGFMLAGLVIGLGAFAGAALNASMEFEKGMANVQTLIGTGTDVDARIESLGESVKKMSITTGKSLKDLTRGLYDVIGTFTDTADSARWLETAAKAGAAGMSTTHDAILLLSAITKAYGDSSFEAAQKASDLVFETANLGVTTFPEMAASMGKVLPIAAALKVSQEELFGAMATLTGVTGDTALVTTQLRSVMNAFLKPNTLMRKAIEETGYASGAAMVEQVGLSGAMKLIGGTSVTASRGIAAVFGRVEALTAVLALSGAQADDWVWKTEAMRNAAGRTDRAFKIQQATVAAMVDRIQAAIGVLAVNIGDKLMPMWSSLLAEVEAAMPAIENAVLTAVDVIVAAFQVLATGIGFVVGVIQGVWNALGAVGMQAPFVVAALVLITAAFVAWGIAAAAAAVPVILATWPVLAVIVAIALAVKALMLIFEALGISGQDVFNALATAAKIFMQALFSVTGSIVHVISMIPGPLQESANEMKATLDIMHDSINDWGTAAGQDAHDAGLIVGTRINDGLRSRAEDLGGPVINEYKKAGASGGKAFLEGLDTSIIEGMTLSEAQLEDLGISLDDALAAGINVGEPQVAAAVKSLVEVFGTSMEGVLDAARENGGAAMSEMAKGILAARQAPVDALVTLKEMLKTAMSPVAEQARLAGQAISRTLAKGLRSKDPAVRAQAEATKKLIIERLRELAESGLPLGKKAARLLAKGLKSKDPEIRAAARAARDAANGPLTELAGKAYAAGSAAAQALVNGLRSRLKALTGPQIVVRVNEHGPTEGYAKGAWSIPRDQVAFLHEGEMVVPAAAASRIRDESDSTSYTALSGGKPKGPVIGTMNLTINPDRDVSRSSAQRFGQTVLDVVAGGLREQTARGAI